MATGLLQDRIPGGFSFENCYRNQRLEKSGLAIPKATKTGTTICGVVFKDGVVLGADTRATSGNIVAEKNCEKIHYISDNIYCCGAGTAADTGMTTRMISSKVELHRLNSGRQPRVILPLRLLKDYLFGYRGYVGAALILGGVDYSGPHLYSVAPHGSSDKLPYVTMGSGSLAAMSVLESRFRFDMDRTEAMQLVRDAIAAGIFNDLGSGSFVDLCVITKEGAQYLRPYDVANKKGQRAARYNAPAGSTAILSRTVQKVEFDVVTTRVIRDMPDPKEEAMDVA
ncbi:20S proteasome subunit beta 2 [Paragonimus westermani]|uniref:Proteasome subunit beta n=1 Tax=Paragonimus westermani TaxID=34504 RepID=A0A5J4NTZ7_9TREM|nr:20S proteasome subunit beta 2 [Paragonimus westermani]